MATTLEVPRIIEDQLRILEHLNRPLRLAAELAQSAVVTELHQSLRRLADEHRKFVEPVERSVNEQREALMGPRREIERAMAVAAIPQASVNALGSALQVSAPRWLAVDEDWRSALDRMRATTELPAALRQLDAVRLWMSVPSSVRSAAKLPTALTDGIARFAADRATGILGLDESVADAMGAAISTEVAASFGVVTAHAYGSAVTHEDSAFAVIVRAWVEIRTRFPRLTERQFNILLALIALTVTQIFDQWRETARVSDQQEFMAVSTRMARGVELLGGPVAEIARNTAPARYRLTKAALLREEPDAASRPIGKLPAGSEVVQRGDWGRWIFVDVLPEQGVSQAVPITGWIYRRNLRPLELGVRATPDLLQ
ncbi:MAG: hypothetical protein WKG32_08885 [Gemmatimonadaceae bacterium]